jgi:hypothetical protein
MTTGPAAAGVIEVWIDLREQAQPPAAETGRGTPPL